MSSDSTTKLSLAELVAKEMGVDLRELPVFFDEVTRSVSIEVVLAMHDLVRWRIRLWKWRTRVER